jgi:hypothetical protein
MERLSAYLHILRSTQWPRVSSLENELTFCKVYFVAWFWDLIVPVTAGVLVTLILLPSTRQLLFPPVTNSGNGSDANAGDGAMRDNLTSAPETHKGESAEQEATLLVNNIASVALESASGKYGYTVSNDDPAGISEPDIVGAGAITSDALIETPLVDEKTKKPMKKKISKATVQTMRVIGDITDIYEQFSKLVLPSTISITSISDQGRK